MLLLRYIGSCDVGLTLETKSRRSGTPGVFDHVGLLFNKPLGATELLFIEPSDNLYFTSGEATLT